MDIILRSRHSVTHGITLCWLSDFCKLKERVKWAQRAMPQIQSDLEIAKECQARIRKGFSEASPLQNGWIFGKVPIQKFMLQTFAIIKGTSVMNFGTNPQHDFPKMRGGGQRPFGTFPKIHPFWRGDASLMMSVITLHKCFSNDSQVSKVTTHQG